MRGGWFRPMEKRHIGALARHGWLRSDDRFADQKVPLLRQEDKRHIGALARSGWLPSSFRPVRGGRFSRSGRARSRIVGIWFAWCLDVRIIIVF